MKQTIPNVCALVRTYFVCVVCFIVRFRHVDIVIYSLFISKFTSTLSTHVANEMKISLNSYASRIY